jgi:hypothetical protein
LIAWRIGRWVDEQRAGTVDETRGRIGQSEVDEERADRKEFQHGRTPSMSATEGLTTDARLIDASSLKWHLVRKQRPMDKKLGILTRLPFPPDQTAPAMSLAPFQNVLPTQRAKERARKKA